MRLGSTTALAAVGFMVGCGGDNAPVVAAGDGSVPLDSPLADTDASSADRWTAEGASKDGAPSDGPFADGMSEARADGRSEDGAAADGSDAHEAKDANDANDGYDGYDAHDAPIGDALPPIDSGPLSLDGGTNHGVEVGPGFSDVSPHQIVRTQAGVLYAFVPECASFPTCPGNALRAWRGGIEVAPGSFVTVDSAHEPSGDIGTSAVAMDGKGRVHILFTERSGGGAVKYVVFDTATDE